MIHTQLNYSDYNKVAFEKVSKNRTSTNAVKVPSKLKQGPEGAMEDYVTPHILFTWFRFMVSYYSMVILHSYGNHGLFVDDLPIKNEDFP